MGCEAGVGSTEEGQLMVQPSALSRGDEVWDLRPVKPKPGWTGRRVACRVEVLEIRRDGLVLARYDREPARLFGESTVQRWRRTRPDEVSWPR